MLKRGSVLVLIAAGLLALPVGSQGARAKKAKALTPVQTMAAWEKVVQKERNWSPVSAEDLGKSHEGNSLWWEQNVRGSVVVVTGIVKAVKRSADLWEMPCVQLDCPDTWQFVECSFTPGQAKKLAQLVPGEQVK